MYTSVADCICIVFGVYVPVTKRAYKKLTKY